MMRRELTEKLINVAIFWMPLIAGIILGGMSPSVWYGGDKIAAIWMTFFGIALLLLTATFQIQSFVQENVLQPQLEVLAPTEKSILTWDPPADNSFNIKGENDNLQPGGWRVPTFTLRNLTPVNAQDVTVTWSAVKYDATGLTTNNPIFSGRSVAVASQMLTIAAPGGSPFQMPFAFTLSQNKPFITRTAETFIPLDVWDTAALFFVATLSSQIGSVSEPYYFDLAVTWNIPSNSKSLNYRIKAVATNMKPPTGGPAILAAITFTIDKIAP